MHLIPPMFTLQQLIDSEERKVMADWWEEHGEQAKADFLRHA